MQQIISTVLSFEHAIENVTNVARNHLIRAAIDAKEDMQITTINFETVAPDFFILDTTPQFVEIGPRPTFGGLIWFWLDQGTQVRYAHMYPDFRPKTYINTLNTYGGAGRGLAFVDTRKPRPGIAARNWTIIITRKRGAEFQQAIRDSLFRIQLLKRGGEPKSRQFFQGRQRGNR